MRTSNLRTWLTAICAATLWAGCAGNQPAEAPRAKEPPKPLRLIFITCSAEARFFEPVKKGMRDAAEMLGVQAEFTGTQGVDLTAQAEMVRRAVADGCDGIALNIIHPTAFDEVVKEAIGAGVPVVAFNCDDHSTPNARLSAVNQRYYEAGRKLGQHVAPHVPEKAHVLLTLHDAGISSLEDRQRGIQEALKDKSIVWKVLVGGNRAEQAAEKIAAALREDPEIRIVLGTGQADTEAAGLAVEKHFAGKDYWSAGFDLSPNTLRLVKAGTIRCTIDQQPYIQGFFPVVQLTLYLRYGIAPSSMDAGAAIIDRQNVERVTDLTARGYR